MSSCRSLVGLAAYATGAIVMAAGGYYYVHKCGHEERRTEAFEGTPVDEDPVQIVSSGFLQSSDGHKDTQMDKANPEGCLEKAEEKDEEDEVSVVQLNSEELHVPNLVEKVTQLEKLFSVVHRKSEIKSKELEQERQAQRVLKEKYEDMKNNLEHENSNLKDQVKTLQGSVEKLEGEPHEMCEEKLKSQKCELMKLEEIRRNMEEMLFEVVREFKKERKEREREQKDHTNLLSQYEHIKGCPADTQKNAQNTQRCSTLEKEMLTLMEHLKCMQGLLEDPVRSEL